MLRSDTIIDHHQSNYNTSNNNTSNNNTSNNNTSNNTSSKKEYEKDNIIRGLGKFLAPTHYNITDFILESNVPYADRTNLNKPALMDPITGQSLSYQTLRTQVDQVASGLINNMKLKKGDVLALFSYNQIQFVTILLGAMKVGIVVTTVNANYEVEELKYQLDHSEAKVMVVDWELINIANEANELLTESIPIIVINDDQYHHPITTTIKDKEEIPIKYHQLLSDLPYSPLNFSPNTEECQTTDAIIIYSSGTTGNPKGIVSTHYNMIYSILQGQSAMFRINHQTQYLLGVTPFYHSYGLNLPLLQGLHRQLTLLPLRKFQLDSFLTIVEKFKLDYLLLTPPILHQLANDDRVEDYNLCSIRRIMSAGSPLPLELAERVMRRLKCHVEQGYGMTEGSSFLTVTDSNLTPPNSVGRLLPNLEAKIVHPESRLNLPMGERGELWIRGNNNMKGYLKNRKATRAIFDHEGFMDTGDIAHFDLDHQLFLFDRVKDLIRYDEFRTSPSSLENELLKFSSLVADVCVIGLPLPTLTDPRPERQLPRAYIVLRDPLPQSHQLTNTNEDDNDDDDTNIDDHDILTTLRHQLNLTLPNHQHFTSDNLIVVPTILKSPAGKILRKLVHQNHLMRSGEEA